MLIVKTNTRQRIKVIIALDVLYLFRTIINGVTRNSWVMEIV